MNQEANIDNRKGAVQFNIQRMEAIYKATKGKPDKPHRHDYYTILFVKNADGQHIVDYNAYAFGKSEIHFVSPGQVHQVLLDSEPQGHVITFSKDFLVENNIPVSFISNVNLFRSFDQNPPLKLDHDSESKIEDIVDDMKTCLPLQIEYRMRALGALLQLFLIYSNNSLSMDQKQNDQKDRSVCILRDFKKLVDENYQKWHKLMPYSKAIRLTSKHLSSTIKERTGKTAKEMIQDRILLEAKRMLLFTDNSAKEIAYTLGFTEPLHFSSFFKKKEGISPTAFRYKRMKSEFFI